MRTAGVVTVGTTQSDNVLANTGLSRIDLAVPVQVSAKNISEDAGADFEPAEVVVELIIGGKVYAEGRINKNPDTAATGGGDPSGTLGSLTEDDIIFAETPQVLGVASLRFTAAAASQVVAWEVIALGI